jgi:hypothetical protein
MSIRTVPRVAAALLLAAAAPAGAQQPLPVAPMPRAVTAQRFEIKLTPGERNYVAIQMQTLRDDVYQLAKDSAPGCVECQSSGPKDVVFAIGPGGLRRVMPMPEPPRFRVPATPIPTGSFVVHEDGHVTTATAAVKASACSSCATHTGTGLSGTWYREQGTWVVAVTFAGDEMTMKATDFEAQAAVTMTAHYALTKDGLIHGAITGAEVAPLNDKTAKTELVETALALQELIDHPFSFRAKMTSAGLSLSHLKLSGFEREKKELLGLCGVYTFAKDGKVPEPKSPKAKTARCEECRPAGGAVVGVALGTAVGAACDKGVPLPAVGVKTVTVGADGLERVGVDFATPVPQPAVLACPPPLVVVPAPPAQPVRPVGATLPADSTKQMAVEAFGDLLRDKGVVAGMTLPSPRYLEHYPQVFVPDAAFPLPRELAAQELPAPTASKPKHVGAWVRDVGSKRCVLKVDADHFTLTVSEAHETEGGKTATGHLTLTVEYHLARDGVTAVGLVTGLDIRSEGDLPDGVAREMAQRTGELQKLLEETPVALTLRPYADALVVGGVRMQAANGAMETEPAAYLGGRYRPLTDTPLPPLKAVKAPPPMMSAGPPGGALPPSGAYGGSLMPSGGGDLIAPQQLGRPQPMVPSGASLPPIPRVQEMPLTDLVPTAAVTVPEVPAVRVMPQPQKPGEVVPVSGVTISIPQISPVGLQLDFVVPLNRTPGDNRQLVDFSIGLFGSR